MITIKNFSKNYGKKKVLNNVNITFEDNNVNFIMGKNGRGKTTLLKCISGLEGYKGTIKIDNRKKEEMLGEMNVIWDDCPFYKDLRGIDNLEIFTGLSKKQIIERVQGVIESDLLKKKVKSYSYGQKKKLALAMTVILDSKCIIMDEISNGLDFDTLEQLKAFIKGWKSKKNIILTGHQFSFYDGMVDNVFVICNDGSVKEYINIKDSGKKLEEIYHETMH